MGFGKDEELVEGFVVYEGVSGLREGRVLWWYLSFFDMVSDNCVW